MSDSSQIMSVFDMVCCYLAFCGLLANGAVAYWVYTTLASQVARAAAGSQAAANSKKVGTKFDFRLIGSCAATKVDENVAQEHEGRRERCTKNMKVDENVAQVDENVAQCKHGSVTSHGSNASMRQLKCRDCGLCLKQKV